MGPKPELEPKDKEKAPKKASTGPTLTVPKSKPVRVKKSPPFVNADLELSQRSDSVASQVQQYVHNMANAPAVGTEQYKALLAQLSTQYAQLQPQQGQGQQQQVKQPVQKTAEPKFAVPAPRSSQQAYFSGYRSTSLMQSSRNTQSIASKEALRTLMTKIDPESKLDNDVEDLLIDVAESFIQEVIESSTRLARHRQADTVDVVDAQLVLEKNYNLRVPGFSDDNVELKRKVVPKEHGARVSAVREAIRVSDKKSDKRRR